MSSFSINESGIYTPVFNSIINDRTAGDMLQELQMKLATEARTSAGTSLAELESMQAEQNHVSALLTEARQLQTEAENSGTATTMPEHMRRYMDDNSLAYDRTGNDLISNAREWNIAIRSLQDQLYIICSDIDQKIAVTDEGIGQYAAYLDGVNLSSR